MLVNEDNAHNYYCPFCFANNEESSTKCEGDNCMLWVYVYGVKGSCALAVRDDQKHTSPYDSLPSEFSRPIP